MQTEINFDVIPDENEIPPSPENAFNYANTAARHLHNMRIRKGNDDFSIRKARQNLKEAIAIVNRLEKQTTPTHPTGETQ